MTSISEAPMTTHPDSDRIPPEILAEQWFSFTHRLLGGLQAAFRRSGLSQKDIAKRLDKSPAVISRCLSGQQNMTIRTMHDLARAMDHRLEVHLQPLSELRPTNWAPQSRTFWCTDSDPEGEDSNLAELEMPKRVAHG